MPDKLKIIGISNSGLPFENFEKADYLIIACSDPRYHSHFHQFEKNLPGKIDRIIIPGGPLAFVSASYGLPDTSEAMLDWTGLLVKRHDVKEIILMSHYDCAAYANAIQISGIAIAKTDDCQRQDLAESMQKIKKYLPDTKIKLFMERPAEDGLVEFVEYSADF